jgi:hypothetical protein
MKTVSISTISLILVIVAASSLISMIGLFQIDRIVNQELYRYGLQFSYAWAMPYWTITKVIFATGWFNIIAAVAFHLYILVYGQKEIKQLEPEIEKETYKPEILEVTKPINEEKTEPEPEIKPTEPVEQQKEQEPKPTETVEEKPKETPAPVTETQTQEKIEEPPTAVAETPSQTQTESKPAETQEKSEQPPSKTETPKEIELQPTGTNIL